MKKILYLTLFLTAVFPANAADSPVPAATLVVDVALSRPVGFIATVTGSALFVAISPLTAFANISPPHDAFQIALKSLILAPANFTFNRPVGVMSSPDKDGIYRR